MNSIISKTFLFYSISATLSGSGLVEIIEIEILSIYTNKTCLFWTKCTLSPLVVYFHLSENCYRERKRHFPFHLHSWGQRWLWGLLFLLQSALMFILWPAGTKASNYLTFTWESLRFVAVVVAVVWDTEWVKLNYKGFARPLSHWQVLGHKVTSLLSRGCGVWRRNKQREQVVFWIMDLWVGVWYGWGCAVWMMLHVHLIWKMLLKHYLNPDSYHIRCHIRIWFQTQYSSSLQKRLWWHKAFIFIDCSLWPEGVLAKMLYMRWEG